MVQHLPIGVLGHHQNMVEHCFARVSVPQTCHWPDISLMGWVCSAHDRRVNPVGCQVQDAVLSSKRRTAPHLVAPIKRYATSKLATQYLDTLMREHEGRAEAAAVLAGASPDAGKVKEVLPIIHKPEFLMPNDVLSAIMTQVTCGSTDLTNDRCYQLCQLGEGCIVVVSGIYCRVVLSTSATSLCARAGLRIG